MRLPGTWYFCGLRMLAKESRDSCEMYKPRGDERMSWKCEVSSLPTDRISQDDLNEYGLWLVETGELVGQVFISAFNSETKKTNLLVGLTAERTLTGNGGLGCRMLSRLPIGTVVTLTQKRDP